MRYLVSGKEMKLLDQNTTEHFKVPSQVLMERAAVAFCQKLFSIFPLTAKTKICILCGTGNNGADGIAIGRMLNQEHIPTSIFLMGDSKKASELHKMQLAIYRAYGYREEAFLPEDADLYIDAVFGIGFSRNLEPNIQEIFEKVNSKEARRIAVDIASGVYAGSGEVAEGAFRAHATITFSFEKLGQYLWPGNEYSGQIHLVPVGITAESALDHRIYQKCLEKEDLKGLPLRSSHSNKGTYGKLLLIAGGPQMAGAAVLAAKAAYRMGCGMVKVFTSEENKSILLSALPEVLVTTYGKTLTQKQVIEELRWADAVVLGPGIGQDANAHTLVDQTLQNCTVPLLLDADALNIVSENTQRLALPHTDMVITPHLGEMSRLSSTAVSYIQSNLLDLAQEFANQYNLVCVLKDFRTICAAPYGDTYVNLSGNHGMATAGSGDVLSGIIGSLLAQGLHAEEAASLGVFIHGLAGDLMAEKLSERALTASDLWEGISRVLSMEKKEF